MYIGYRDYVSSSALTDITGSGGFEVGAPLENIKDRRLAVKARRTSIAGFSIRSVFTQKARIGMISILGHHLTSGGATISAELYSASSGGTLIASTGTITLGLVSDGYNFPVHNHIILNQNYTGVGRIEVTIGGTINSVPELGRLWAGPYFQPLRTTTVSDFEVQCRDSSTLNTSIGNQSYADYRGRYRHINCTLTSLSELEAIGNSTVPGTPNIQDIAFYAGRAGNVIVLPVTTPNSSGSSFQVIHKFGVYGHFVEPPTLRYLSSDGSYNRFYTTTFQVAEEL